MTTHHILAITLLEVMAQIYLSNIIVWIWKNLTVNKQHCILILLFQKKLTVIYKFIDSKCTRNYENKRKQGWTVLNQLDFML